MTKLAEKQNIPGGWQEKSLGNFLVISKGKLPKKTYEVADENSVPYLSIKHLDGTEFKYAHKSDGVIADKDDLLVVADGSGSGRMYRGYHGLVSSTFLKISSQSPSVISNDYLEVLFSHLDFTKSRFRKGGAIPHFDFKQLKDVDILLPPVKEQQKIAEILGTVDEDIAKTQEVIRATEKLKRGLMQQLFTRGIGHTKSKETKIGKIPEEWDVISIRNSSIKLIDGDRGANYPKQEDFSPEGHCLFLSAKNVSKNGFIFDEVSFVSKEKDKALRKGKLERGDIILTSRGTVGNVAYYDEKIPFDNIRINSGMLIVRHGEQFDPVFLYRYFSSPQMEAKYSSMGSGSAQPQLPVGSLEQVEVPLIPIKEQKEIANIISAVNEKILVNKKLKEKLTLLKKGLMQDLLNGSKRVSNLLK